MVFGITVSVVFVNTKRIQTIVFTTTGCMLLTQNASLTILKHIEITAGVTQL